VNRLSADIGGAGIQSDQLVRPRSATYHAFPGGVAVVTPTRSDYWTGNLVVVAQPPARDDAERWRAAWKQEVATRSGARHALVQFERAWAERAAAIAQPEPPGVELEWDTVLRATSALVERPVGARRLALLISQGDWHALRGLMMIDEIDPAASADVVDWVSAFLDWRLAMYRDRVDADQGALFGAWDGDALVGAAGILWDAAIGIARYQGVVTHPDHRRQGICSALLARAYHHIADRGWPVIIVSQYDSMQERLYAGIGFAPVSVRGTWHFASEPA
jgi:GNAT superfamily N-acetyltransferase